MGGRHSLGRKLGTLTLAFVFFGETTLFAQVRSVAASNPPEPEPRPVVQSPFFFAPPEPIASREPVTAAAEPPAPVPAPMVPASSEPFEALGSFRQEGDPMRGVWALSPSGFEVTQTLDEGPTFFVSPESHIDSTLRAKVRVDPRAGEEGLFGLVLGYRAPVASEGHDERESDFVLFDWSGRRSLEAEGFTLSRVKGRVVDPEAVFGRREPATFVQVLATEHGPGQGWQNSRWYAIEISYRRGRFRARVDGKSVFDVEGDFPEGRIGFYTFGQAEVTFAELEVEAVNAPPVADAGSEVTLEVGRSCLGPVALDGTGSTDPDGDPLSYLWSGPFGAVSGKTPEVSLAPGTHAVTLTVSDGAGASSTDDVEVTVLDTAPFTLACPADVTLSREGAAALGEPAAGNTCASVEITNDAPAAFSLGTTEVTWTAVDPGGVTASCVQTVTVVGDTPAPEGPSVAASVEEALLWPSNHEFRDVGLEVVATDPSRVDPSIEVEVYSDEPELAPGSGNHAPDAVIDGGTLELRSERSGPGDGRVYLVIAVATNAEGLTSSACTAVVVPHSMSPARVDAVEDEARFAVEHCEATGNAPEGYALLERDAFPVTAPHGALFPSLLCASSEPDGSFIAFFGYRNDNPVPVYVDVGADNRLAPPPGDRGQPSVFRPGMTEAAFSVLLPPGTSVEWLVRGPDEVERAAEASETSPECDEIPSLPDARDDEASTLAGTGVTIDVLANDVDPEGDPLTLARVGAPENGTLVLEPDGSLTYIPNTGFIGVDNFTYTVTDGIGWDQATVRVTVENPNQPPVVDAGADQTIQLPTSTVSLDGTVTDDGLPVPTPSIAWSQVSGPDTVTFTTKASENTDVTFPVDGVYVLRLTADDTQFTVTDDVTVTVLPVPTVEVSIGDVTLTEGTGGLSEAILNVSLSAASLDMVTVDYLTFDGTALAECDYATRFGTVSFDPGVTVEEIRIPIVGDFAQEASETFTVQIGNALGANIVDDTGTVTVNDDDLAPGANRRPDPIGSRTPANRIVGTGPDPLLSWSATDPDSDPLVFDVYFGTSFELTGQAWTSFCTASSPGPRSGAASAYDEANDRLIVFGGDVGGGIDSAETWVLSNATGRGGAPSWSLVDSGTGPSARARATAAYDPGTNRLIVHGGCAGDCTTSLDDTWVLTEANGLGGTPVWSVLAAGPTPRNAAASAYDEASNRLIVFGGSDGTSELGDVQILEDANGIGTPAWQSLAPSGSAPSPRSGASAALDAASNRLIVFGGRLSGDVATNETWVLSDANGLGATPSWSRLAPAGELPGGRWGHVGGYDSGANRLVIFGGTSSGFATGENFVGNDVWVLSDASGASGASAWSQLGPVNGPPAMRLLAASGYSSAGSRLIVALGENNRASPSLIDDLWVLDDPIGRLPAVASGQSGTTFQTTTPSLSAPHFWRVVARDPTGATTGSDVWTFQPNAPPATDAGPDQTVAFTEDASLSGTATDDGLPAPPALTFAWTQVSGPGTATFADASAASTTASFNGAGDFVLRLSASDGGLSTSDDVAVTVLAPNQAPLVDAGPDQTITLPVISTTVSATVTDDGLPLPPAVVLTWSQTSGPATATFANPGATTTDVGFDVAGIYVLRLTADDGALSSFDELTVLVAPANAAPVVDAGADQATSLPAASVSLDATVTDDGLPGAGVTQTWSVASGPGTVTFGDANAEDTTASFDTAGSYTLRLSATDTLLTGEDELEVLVGDPANAADLRVDFVNTSAVVVDPQTLSLSGTIAAVVANDGTGAAVGPFDVTFFEDLNANGALEPLSDNVLGVASHFGIDAGASASVIATVSPSQAPVFRGSLVLAFADSGAVVAETNETNNIGTSAAACRTDPLPTTWSSQLEWSWTGSVVEPDSRNVTMTPAVIDVNADGTPDVLFVTRAVSDGILRAVSGRNGAEIFVTDPAIPLYAFAQIAAGDVDGDGFVEIVTVQGDQLGLIAFEHDGTFKWQSASVESIGWGGPSIAEIDPTEPGPEIVIGRSVLRSNGTLLWEGTAGSGFAFRTLSFAVDLDLDGTAEVLAGNTAYRNDGTIWWQNAGVTDGLNAIGNFDADGFPEIVNARNGKVWLLEHDGTVKWGPLDLTGTTATGTPVVADYDGDGEAEIGISDRFTYYVIETDGTIKWEAPIVDNHGGNGGSAFDFDGDGAAEVVHSEERTLRVMSGFDGTVLFSAQIGNITTNESPIVADVDGDGAAEIVAVGDGFLFQHRGIFVFGEEDGKWTNARGIYNQNPYSITNINDDGTIPANPTPGWQVVNGFRQNALVTVEEGQAPVLGCAFAKPDLTASLLRITTGGSERTLTVRIGNAGESQAPAEVAVSFYDGDPRLGGEKLGTVFTASLLAAGQFEDVGLTVPLSTSTAGSVWVAADDFGGLRGNVTESDEDNNVFDSRLALLGDSGGGLPDLTVTEVDTSTVVTDGQALSVSGSVSATLRNQGEASAGGGFTITFFEDSNQNGDYDPGTDTVLGSTTLASLDVATDTVVSTTVTGTITFADAPIFAAVDATNVVVEANEANNVARSGAGNEFVPPVGDFELVTEWSWTSSTTEPTATNVSAPPVVADLNQDGVPDVVFSTFIGGGTGGAFLRAVDGATGAELFTNANSAERVFGEAGLAVGDIDDDGFPEIFGGSVSPSRLAAFEHDGTFKWQSDAVDTVIGGAPSIAEIDPLEPGREIVLGRSVLRSDGTLLWMGTAAAEGENGATGPMSVVADLDLDGTPEIVVGNTAYRNDGTIFWENPDVPDGITAVGNFDTDEFPEITHVRLNELRLLEHTGAVRWGPLPLPGLGNLGPPAVADFDGDGRPEIAVATKDELSVVETAGLIRWSAPVTNSTVANGGTGVSAFDFDGDGVSEVLYVDEASLRVYSGTDGAVLAESTAFETCHHGRGYPTVADVDADGFAEIVVGLNDACTGSTTFGVYAVGDALGHFLGARGLWNQHGYSVTNINDDLTVPLVESPSWLADNSFRKQVTEGFAFAAPDLTASFARRTTSGTDLVFTVRIANGGLKPVSAGVPVSAYNSDPRTGGTLLGTTATTLSLEVGDFEEVSFTVPSSTPAVDTVFFVADDAGGLVGTVNESDEDNNIYDSTLTLNEAPVVDAGPDATTALPGASLTLVGGFTDDGFPIGGSVSVTWEVDTSPPGSMVVFADPSSLTTGVTFDTAGGYILRLRVSDSLREGFDKVNVFVDPTNQPPTVDAGADQTISLPADQVTLSGTASDDGFPSTDALSVLWTQVTGPATVVFSDADNVGSLATFTEAGEYVLRLTADDGALQVSDELTVTVTPPNQAPVVNAGPDETVFSPATMLAGRVSDDGLPLGGSVTASWAAMTAPGAVLFDDASSPSTMVRFGAAGSYTLRLTADDTALQGFDDVVVTVDVTNVAPIVNAGADQTILLPTNTASLSGSVSDDGVPSATVTTWSQLSGPGTATFTDPAAPVTTVTFDVAGFYTLRLSATDGDLTSTDDVVIFVDDGNVAPTVNAGVDQTITLPTNQVTLAGSASDDGLPAGGTLSFTWSQVSGPGLVAFADPSLASTTATFDAAGDYILRLTVSDGRDEGFDDVLITVEPGPPGAPPVVSIDSPTEGQGVTDFTDVVGTVTSSDLLSWRVETREQGTATFTRIGSGNTEQTSAVLATFDPTLLMNGLHEIRLTATDNANQSTSTSVFVVVEESLKIGHFTVSFVDLEVPVSGLPIRITRTYDSRDKTERDFGFGWKLDLTTLEVSENGIPGVGWNAQQILGGLGQFCVLPNTPKVVSVTMPDGEVFEFQMRVTPECQLVPILDVTVSFQPLPGTNATLEPADGNFAFVGGTSGPVELYGPSFALYDPQVYRLTLPDGRAFVIDQDEGLQSLTDLNGNQLTVTPNGITHSSGKGVTFERDAEGRITSITDPNGNPMFYGYDAAGDLVSFRDREDNETTFTYLAEVPHHLDGIEDPRGISPIRNDYDPLTGRLIRHTDAFNNTIEYNHDIGARQEILTDRELNVRVLAYDERGNVIHETDPRGKVILRSFDANNNRTCETEAHDPAQSGPDCESSPNPTLFTYDANDNLLSQTDPERNTTSFTYNARHQVETTTDAKNNVTTNVYDPATGNLTKTIDTAGTETDFTYDATGNVKTQTVTVGGVVHTTSFDYDSAGNLVKETDAEGNETTFTYDSNGNRLTETRTRTLPGGGTETLTTTFTYDKLGRLVRTEDPDGTFTRTVYDAIGKQKETFDKLGRKTTFEYDSMGQLSKITYPDTTTEEFTYDNEGRRLTSKDRAGRTTSFEYDELGRLTKTTFPDTTFTQNVYDDAGRFVQTIDARGKATSFEYDQAGRRTAIIDPLLNRTELTYDANGNQETIKDPKLQVTTFEYDALNRRTKTIFPDTTFTEIAYDELGRRVSETDQAGIVTGFEYDKLGRLTKVIQDVGGLALETTYGYDEVGNRISQTDANLHTTSFEYDALGRETKRTLPDGTSETKAYDAAGNLATWTKFDGSVINYRYDVNDRLILKDFPTGTDVSFTYTATGRRDTVTDARGITNYAYDLRDRLQTLTYPDGRKLDYGYDENGNRTSLTATIGATVLTTTYTYDDASRLDLVTDPNGGTYDHDYDSNGNRAALSYPNGTNTTYAYDDLNRLTNLTTTGPSGTIQSYDFTLGPAGNRTQIDEADGTTRAYDYDNLYRLTLETVRDAASVLVYQKSFVYDDVGNRETQTTTGLGAGTINYTYDTRDRLLTENGTTYGYDDNGNLTSKSGEATYTWDFEERLIRVDKTDGTVVEHVYDTDGVRVRTTTTPAGGTAIVTDFLLDTSRPLSHVVAESGGTGVFVAYYVRGDDLLSVIRSTEQRYYHADGLGSIRFLTDELGGATDNYTYTAFGEELSHVGTDVQPYQFAGEPFDLNIGFYYNRARWLDPGVGRFTRVDIFRGTLSEPISLHRYLYADANPPNRTDPTGRFSLAEISSVTGIRSVISSISSAVNVGFRVLKAAETIQDATEYARLATKIIEALSAPTLAAAQAIFLSEIESAFAEFGGVSGLMTSFTAVVDAVGPNWERMSEEIAKKGPLIAAEAFSAISGRIPTYVRLEKEGRLKFVVFAPSGPGGRKGDRFVKVSRTLQIAIAVAGGRLFGFGVRTSRSNVDQIFRIDYWDRGDLNLHYHILSGKGQTIWTP